MYSKEPEKKEKEKVFCSTYVYDGVVKNEDANGFDVPKYRLKMILNCYDT